MPAYYRLSLRSTFVLVTLFCAFLATITAFVLPRYRAEKAWRSIEALGFTVCPAFSDTSSLYIKFHENELSDEDSKIFLTELRVLCAYSGYDLNKSFEPDIFSFGGADVPEALQAEIARRFPNSTVSMGRFEKHP